MYTLAYAKQGVQLVPIRFDPASSLEQNVVGALATLRDEEVRDILIRHTRHIMALKDANTQPNRDVIITQLSDLIQRRAQEEASE